MFLISALAEHTRNLMADARASLLVAENVAADPLANGRVTLLGRCVTVESEPEREAARRAFLAVHPNAAYYADYRDFSWWRLAVEAVRYIGGYGRMSWVTRAGVVRARPDPMARHAQGILEHMNADHAAALLDYCRTLHPGRGRHRRAHDRRRPLRLRDVGGDRQGPATGTPRVLARDLDRRGGARRAGGSGEEGAGRLELD